MTYEEIAAAMQAFRAQGQSGIFYTQEVTHEEQARRWGSDDYVDAIKYSYPVFSTGGWAQPAAPLYDLHATDDTRPLDNWLKPTTQGDTMTTEEKRYPKVGETDWYHDGIQVTILHVTEDGYVTARNQNAEAKPIFLKVAHLNPAKPKVDLYPVGATLTRTWNSTREFNCTIADIRSDGSRRVQFGDGSVGIVVLDDLRNVWEVTSHPDCKFKVGDRIFSSHPAPFLVQGIHLGSDGSDLEYAMGATPVNPFAYKASYMDAHRKLHQEPVRQDVYLKAEGESLMKQFVFNSAPFRTLAGTLVLDPNTDTVTFEEA